MHFIATDHACFVKQLQETTLFYVCVDTFHSYYLPRADKYKYAFDFNEYECDVIRMRLLFVYVRLDIDVFYCVHNSNSLKSKCSFLHEGNPMLLHCATLPLSCELLVLGSRRRWRNWAIALVHNNPSPSPFLTTSSMRHDRPIPIAPANGWKRCFKTQISNACSTHILSSLSPPSLSPPSLSRPPSLSLSKISKYYIHSMNNKHIILLYDVIMMRTVLVPAEIITQSIFLPSDFWAGVQISHTVTKIT